MQITDMRQPMNENSLANLQPPWQPGQSGNPRGRPAAGASVIEWMNLMAEWPEEKIEAMAEDPQAPANKRIAARRLLAAITGDPERDAREAAAFVCDYSDGRPRQRAVVRHENLGTVGARLAQLAQVDPQLRELAEAMSARMGKIAAEEEHGPQIVADVEAVEVKPN